MKSQSLFEGDRLSVRDAIALSLDSLTTYAERYQHWVAAFSGGKDSSATVTFIAWAIANNLIPRPKSFSILYSDTRMELTPLQVAAMQIMERLRADGMDARVVMPEMDDRFFVYMFGRGVPPPSNTFRWCTSQLKIEPMTKALEERAVALGFGEMAFDEKKNRDVYIGFGKDMLLTITGVRLGESAARDQRIALSCSRDGAECGQGWLQQSAKEGLNDTLAPLLHWRVCHVWDWLMGFVEDHDFPTVPIAETYGIAEDGSAAELGTRTGCVGCNLASDDTALKIVLKQPHWQYLQPYQRLRPLYAELKKPHNRLRKNGERRQDGSLAANQGRLGPLTMDARLYGLGEVLAIQGDINQAAHEQGRPTISLINSEEHARILDLITVGTWPQKWDGTEARGDELLAHIHRDGTIQPLIFGE
jgi:DNA sulfur modification protein DndC